MAGYRKLEAQVIPAKHMVVVVDKVTAKQIKEWFEPVPNQSLLVEIRENTDRSLEFIFEEDAMPLKVKLGLK